MTAGEFLTLVEMEADNSPATKGGKIKRKDVAGMAADLELTDEEWWLKYGPTAH